MDLQLLHSQEASELMTGTTMRKSLGDKYRLILKYHTHPIQCCGELLQNQIAAPNLAHESVSTRPKFDEERAERRYPETISAWEDFDTCVESLEHPEND